MVSLSPSNFSISTKSLQLKRSDINSSGKQNIRKISANSTSLALGPQPWKFNENEGGYYGLPRSSIFFRFICNCHAPALPVNPRRWFSSIASSAASDQTNVEIGLPGSTADNCEMGFNRVDCLVRVLHKSARSFSTAIQCHELARSSIELAKAWVGVDVHAWHKRIAYQAAVYALLNTAMEAMAIEARFLLSDEYGNDPSPVHKILSPKISVLWEDIESQLNAKDSELVKWFKMVKLPLLAGLFIPLFKRWSAENERSGVAVIVLAISCCVAVGKLGAGRISCPMFTLSIPDIVGELMDLSHSLVSMDKLYCLASEAGLEQEFLIHFGAKILHNKTSQEFWIGLVQKKLAVAFHRESVISGMKAFHNTQDLERDLAILGLFAFLGRRTRLFLSCMGIKDLDEQVKDFLSYLECGSLFIYPELSSLPVYQLFMEVVAEEIGWLDFYATVPCISHHEKRRSKQHAIQAEKEIILSAVFSVCSDVFSGFAHFSNSTQQSLDTNVVSFLFRSQNLLTICLEDYWAAYCRSGELLKIAERGVPESVLPLGIQGTINGSVFPEAHRKPADLMNRGAPEYIPQHLSQMNKASSSNAMDAVSLVKLICDGETKTACESLFRKYSNKLISTSCDVWMGTRLLFIDISIAVGLLLKQIRGHKITERERKKLKRTLADFASVIPVTILMLLPVSAVGHAAIFAAIKKYIPCLIPSPYSPERLDIVKQLKRTRKMQVQS